MVRGVICRGSGEIQQTIGAAVGAMLVLAVGAHVLIE